jgi:hypothetical protein
MPLKVLGYDGAGAGGIFSSKTCPGKLGTTFEGGGNSRGLGLTRGCGGGGLVVLRLASLPEHSVNLQHVHPLAQLMLELCQPLLCGDLFPCQSLHLVLILLLLPLQGLGT